jgi:hypothetical protein
MATELIICILCLTGFFLFSWAVILRLYINELDKKVKSLEKYLIIDSKFEPPA